MKSIFRRHAAFAIAIAIAIGSALASSSASALSCRSAIYSGVIEIRCTEPKDVTSECRWSADVTAEGGGKGVRAGTFLVRKRTKDELVVREMALDGKRIVGGTVKMEGCAIGVPDPEAAKASAPASAASGAGGRRSAPGRSTTAASRPAASR